MQRIDLLHGYCAEHQPSVERIANRPKDVGHQPTPKILKKMGNFQQRIDILIEERATVFTAYSNKHLHAALFLRCTCFTPSALTPPDN